MCVFAPFVMSILAWLLFTDLPIGNCIYIVMNTYEYINFRVTDFTLEIYSAKFPNTITYSRNDLICIFVSRYEIAFFNAIQEVHSHTHIHALCKNLYMFARSLLRKGCLKWNNYMLCFQVY